MDKASLEDNFKFEKDYWWFIGRRKIVSGLIEKFYKGGKKSLALDAGCGTGIMLKGLEKYAVPVGVDISEMALDYARRRGCERLVAGDLCKLPFEDETFDLITVLGVLYNKDVADDEKALKESYRVLKKGGVMIVDEAAYKFLQSRHNISVDGIRRYTRSQLVSKAKACGFKVLKASYWNMCMLPLFFAIVKLENCLGGDKRFSKLARIPRPLNDILKRYLYLEAFLMKHVSFPFGPSIVMVVKKR